jgi:alpha-1,2-mannosyltransferase
MGPGPPVPTTFAPYVYPPVLAFAMVPLLTLPTEIARMVWYGMSFAAVLLTALLLARLFVGRGLMSFLIVATLLQYFQPVRRNLALAQVDVLALGLLALGLAAFVRRRDVWAGIAVASAVALKPFLGFVVLYFLWKRAYRAAVATVLTAGLLVGGSLIVLGPATIVDYITATSYWSSPQFAVTIANQSPSGMLLRAFTDLHGQAKIANLSWLVLPLRAIVSVLSVAILAYVISRDRSLPPATLAAEYGLTLVAMLFVSPLGEDLHYVYAAIVLLASAAIVYRGWRHGRTMRLVGVGLLATYGIFLFPMHRLLERDGPFYGLCAIAVVGTLPLLVEAQRRRQASSDPSPILPPSPDAAPTAHAVPATPPAVPAAPGPGV